MGGVGGGALVCFPSPPPHTHTHLNFLNGQKFVFPGLFQIMIIRFKTYKNDLTSKFSIYHNEDGLLHSKYF